MLLDEVSRVPASTSPPIYERGIEVGEFEQRQLRATRYELNRAHAERTEPVVRPATSASPVRLSS
jgi:hypothetical protein